MRRHILMFSVFSILLMRPAIATPLTWDGSAGNWDDNSHWLPNGTEPTDIDDVTIAGGQVDVTFSGEEADQIRIDGGSINISGGGSLSDTFAYVARAIGSTASASVTGPGSTWTSSSLFSVGHYGNATLGIHDGGMVMSNIGTIGNSFDATGVVTVNGAGSAWINSSNLYVGHDGDGTLTVQDGGYVENTVGWVGFGPGSDSLATVTGAGSTWNNTSHLNVGGYPDIGPIGTGVLNVLDSGLVDVLGELRIWSLGTVTLDGGSINAMGGLDNTHGGALNILDGTLIVTGGAFAIDVEGATDTFVIDGPNTNQTPRLILGAGATATSNGGLSVGNSSNGRLHIQDGAYLASASGNIGTIGMATITGAGSTWTNSGTLSVNGELNILDGGVVSNAQGEVGFDYTEPESIVTASGTGSTWNNDGDLYVGYFGNAVLDIEDGGIVNVGQNTWVDASNKGLGSGAIEFNNGTLNTGSLLTSPQYLKGTGTINTNGMVSDIDLVFDATNGLQQQILFDSQPGQEVTINLDATINSGTGMLGAGYHGAGTLTIADGLSVSSDGGVLGQYPGSTGVATVTGSGSSWMNSSYLFVGGGGDYFLGEGGGDGTLNIENGALVANTIAYIGGVSTGIVTVTGTGSTWNNSEGIAIGVFGSGTLNILNGGTVSSSNGSIAVAQYSTGLANVVGLGSTWTMPGTLTIGSTGEEGTLTIQDGGVVSSGDAYIGLEAMGTVIVSGPGSTWFNSNDLYVGVGAELIVQDGGHVEVGDTLRVLSFGAVRGNGDINAINLRNGGVISPGNNTGVLKLTGAYTQESTGTLRIELAGGVGVPGVDYDRFEVDGNVMLAGALHLTLLDTGYLPSIGDSFPVLTADSVTGVFGKMTGTIITADRGFSVSYPDGQSVVVEVVPMSPIAADLNGDGFVGIDDLNIVLGRWNQTVTASVWPLGDVSGDGFVGIEDLNAVLGNWNTGTPPVTTVPEPAIFAVLTACALAMLRSRA